jgi:GT2 family glycosyltransferase
MLVRGRLPASAVVGTATVALVGFGGRRKLLETPLPALDERSAFAVFAAIPGLRPDERFWFLEVSEPGGRIERIPFHCPPAPPPLRGIEAALALLEPPPRDAERVLEQAVAPATDGFWHAARHPSPAATVATYGRVADAPRVSVVVSFDGPIERIRHQIVQFSNDSEFRSGTTVELIYVVDDISVTEELRRLCQSLNGTYGVPFRIVTLDRRSDRVGAANAGAKAARGSVLLFLGADVLPKRSRWVGQLLRSYRRLEHCGVLGCRLLFEDGSIRHGGITFRAETSMPGLWEDHDPRIGLPNQLEPLGGALRVPAVTGACLLVDRALFDQLGGFAEECVFGDFADYDLCLGAQQRGWRVYCTPEVELYQLGSATATSAAQWQEQLTRYNRWKHSRKWRSLMPTILAAAEA